MIHKHVLSCCIGARTFATGRMQRAMHSSFTLIQLAGMLVLEISEMDKYMARIERVSVDVIM